MNLHHPSLPFPIFPFRHPTRQNVLFPFSSFGMRGLEINPKITSCTQKRFPLSHVNRNIHHSFKDALTCIRHTVLVIMSEFLYMSHTHICRIKFYLDSFHIYIHFFAPVIYIVILLLYLYSHILLRYNRHVVFF